MHDTTEGWSCVTYAVYSKFIAAGCIIYNVIQRVLKLYNIKTFLTMGCLSILVNMF